MIVVQSQLTISSRLVVIFSCNLCSKHKQCGHWEDERKDVNPELQTTMKKNVCDSFESFIVH